MAKHAKILSNILYMQTNNTEKGYYLLTPATDQHLDSPLHIKYIYVLCRLGGPYGEKTVAEGLKMDRP